MEAIETTAVAIVAPMKRGRPKEAVQPTTTKNVRTKWSSEDTITLLRLRYQDETIHRKFLNVKNHADRARAWNTLALRFNAAAGLNYVYDQVLLPIRVNIYESFLLIYNPSVMSLKDKEKLGKLLAEYREIKTKIDAAGNATDDPIEVPDYRDTMVECIRQRAGLSGESLGDAEAEGSGVSEVETKGNTPVEEGPRKKGKAIRYCLSVYEEENVPPILIVFAINGFASKGLVGTFHQVKDSYFLEGTSTYWTGKFIVLSPESISGHITGREDALAPMLALVYLLTRKEKGLLFLNTGTTQQCNIYTGWQETCLLICRRRGTLSCMLKPAEERPGIHNRTHTNLQGWNQNE